MFKNQKNIFIISIFGVVILALNLTFWILTSSTSPKLSDQNSSSSSTASYFTVSSFSTNSTTYEIKSSKSKFL